MFTKFWLRRPERFGKRMSIYALLEGPSATGAYHFTIEPGVETQMHVKAVLFFRKKTEHAAYAPLTSMYIGLARIQATPSATFVQRCTIRTVSS